MARSQGEELYQGGRLPEAPGILGNGSGTYINPNPTEQPYPYGFRFLTYRSLSTPHMLGARRTHPLLPILIGVALPYTLAHFPTRVEVPPMKPARSAVSVAPSSSAPSTPLRLIRLQKDTAGTLIPL